MTAPWTAWDVTELVTAWLSGVEQDYGLAVGADFDHPENGARGYFYSLGSGAAYEPYLSIEYNVPCPSDPYAAAQTSDEDTVYDWNGVFQDVIRKHAEPRPVQTPPLDPFKPPPPTATARAAAILNIAIFDTLNSAYFAKLEDEASGTPTATQVCGWEKYQVLAETDPDVDADLAASVAAKTVLLALYPDFADFISSRFTAITGAAEDEDAETLGTYVAATVLAGRSSDGSTNMTAYTPDAMTLGAWRPTPTASLLAPCPGATTPNWGLVTPFALTSGSQFRYQEPGGFTTYASLLASEFYEDEVEAVRLAGDAEATTGDRSEDQTKAAWFWANDLIGTYKPPGQMLEHTKLVAMTQPAADTSGDPEDFFREWTRQGIRVSHLFAEVSIGLADAAIAAWDRKYRGAIDLWRPIDAIRLDDGNVDTVQDTGWEPLSRDYPAEEQFNPCFPAYVSGHATFGAAWSRILENEFQFADYDDPFPLTLTTEDPHAKTDDVFDTRMFDSFAEAAEENAASRIWLGVHYPMDAEGGLVTGRHVGDQVTSTRLRWAQTCAAWACTTAIP